MIRRLLTVVLFAGCVTVPSSAIVLPSMDVVVLRDGRRLEGEVERNEGGSIHLRNRFGKVVLSATRVLRIEESPSAEQRLRERRAGVDASDPTALVAFADWAGKEGFGAAATEALGAAIRLDPEHQDARQRLGHRKVEGRWLPFEEAMQALDKVRDQGEWVDRQVAEERRRVRAERDRVRKLQRRVNALVRRMAGASDRGRNDSRDQLLAIALAERRPDLGARIHAMHREYQQWWDRERVLVEIRTGYSKLVRMDEITTSLGSGSPVRIQLPRMRTVSIGTTVLIPGR